MEHGELIKKLRTDRHISRQELVEGIHSVSTLQRLENSNSKIDVDTLWVYLEKMNVQIDEYYAEFHSYQPSKKDIFRENFRKSIISNHDANELLKKLQNEYDSSQDIFFLYLIVQTKAVAERLPNYNLNKITRDEITTVLEYLSRIEEWGYFELAIYTNCLGIFGTKFRTFQYKDVLKQFRKFRGLPKYQHALIKFIINSIILEFSDKNYDVVVDLLGNLYDETSDSDYIKGRIYWKFFVRMYQSILGEFEFEGAVAIETLKILGYEEDAKNLLDIEKEILNDHV